MKKVVKFTKENCPHCKIFDPIFEEVRKDYAETIEFFAINTEEAPHIARKFDVKFVPSLYVFESEDFETFNNIEQLVIGHSHERYQGLKPALNNLL